MGGTGQSDRTEPSQRPGRTLDGLLYATYFLPGYLRVRRKQCKVT